MNYWINNPIGFLISAFCFGFMTCWIITCLFFPFVRKYIGRGFYWLLLIYVVGILCFLPQIIEGFKIIFHLKNKI